MRKAVVFICFVTAFCFAAENVGDISKVEDFRQIDNDRFCAGVGFVKSVEDASDDAGFIIYNASNNSIFSMTLVDEENRYFSSHVRSCLPNNESVVLLQVSNTEPLITSQLKLTLHKFSTDNNSIVFSRDFLSEFTRVYPCSANAEDEKIIIEVVVDESKDATENDNRTFSKRVLSFNDNFEFEEMSSLQVEKEEMQECYKSKAPFFRTMFKNLSF